ncbi:uridine kinase [Yamadazyma tenuis]|uniref:p-loop containing nucleoside triphosphate hydrolase protein n=1 Tax=Candida tenuis (strain ATCC 10573 / BCRC 21748 / CBS 615 / JCM 9827 / NBRC 10315 / NRRL Y-1498 / VKM Y-70) TaxID=590646 RepID=G3B1D5_CANTC|nr:P-loop containing nucleoside triphosphate hydrolase protein [Yamadazyma tenuis ATCC 10573]EGV64946.1 P-loop containing nucleoside triphosphate hydrolase protein [Yamadazyma tenuis ATCC 10573]WEJ97742.1 uridine kinase [Yamadazyma tenuis]
MDFEPILVLIGGGHASGKKTAASLLKKELQRAFLNVKLDIKLLDMENFLKPENKIQESSYSSSKSAAITVKGIGEHDFPPLKPSRYDFSQLQITLKQVMVKGRIIILHGLYALYDKEIRAISKIKVFISSDADTRLIRWIRRDVVGGHQNLETVINRYLQGARAEMNDFINPTKEFSDVIMPTGPESNSIELLVDGIIPYISKLEAHVPHLRSSGSLVPEDKQSFYELT